MSVKLVKAKHVLPRVNAARVQRIKIYQVVAHLVRRIGKLHRHLLRAPRYSLKAYGKAVAALYREHHANVAGGEFGFDILRYIVNGGKVAVRPCNDGLCNANDVLFVYAKAFLFSLGKHTVHSYGNNVVPLADYGGADSS